MGKMKQLFATPKKAAMSGICLGCILAVFGAGTAFAATAIAKGSSIGEENAKNFAFADLGIDPLSAENVRSEFDFEQGQFVYEIEFTANGTAYEYWIKATDGTVLKKEIEWTAGAGQTGNLDQITPEQAIETALADAALSISEVTFTKTESDIEDGYSVYDIEFFAGNTKYEYEINKNTGVIYCKSKETFTPQGTGTPVQGGNAAEAGQPDSVQSQPETSQPAAPSQGVNQLSLDDAKDIAVSDTGLSIQDVIFTKAKSDYKDGILIYEIDFYTSTHKYEYEIVASTGTILCKEKEILGSGHGHIYDTHDNHNSTHHDDVNCGIGTEQAKSIASTHAGLTISDVRFTKAEADYEDGILVYEIEFYHNGMKYEYEINAITGDILEHNSEWRD